ncbi:uncharacterized protein LOC133338325 [Musca vetustissima]|uniref:uncharacterized protein LOC133338325 n=1 Tax=Musca vetustissima TaxID=27455 RepID=UPI002AB7BD8A|nr:uncharacterized protein LOC133338325 [Musca vetustissima]
MLKDKPRKILNLEERVQAIRMYDELPVYQRVASAFKCSWEQIKNIVANRKQILKYYASCQIIDVMKDDSKVVRHKKINFLGNCMYEYIKRAHYHNLQQITDDVIRDRAMEFKEMINIEKFFPNRAWIRDFKSVFNIDLEHMNQIIVSRKPQKSLNCKDIITYCAKEVDHALSSQPGSTKNQMLPDSSGGNSMELGEEAGEHLLRHPIFDSADSGEEQPHYDEDMFNEHEEVGPTINFGDYQVEEIAEDGQQQDDIKPDVSILESMLKGHMPPSSRQTPTDLKIKEEDVEEPPEPYICRTSYGNMSSTSATSVTDEGRAPPTTITSYEEALAFLEPLEDFAIFEEDFKAINLLTQLAEVFEKRKKRRIQIPTNSS